MKGNILITICARAGSKGVKGKNLRLLNGKPLIFYTISQALQWGKASHIVVSTDSLEIAEFAKSNGAEVPWLRPKKLAGDKTPKLLVIRHALTEIEKLYKETYDVIIDLDPTSPIRTPKDIESAYRIFLQKKPHVVFSVTKAKKNPYFNMVEKDTQGIIVLSKKLDGKIMRRQDAPVVYDMNASIYIYDRSYIICPNAMSAISDHNAIHIMRDISAVDIDRELDFRFVEFLMKEGVVSL